MKIDRFEVGKSYKTCHTNGAIATVIARNEKTVTFRVMYSFYYGNDEGYCAWEEIVTKRIFMAGSEETSLTEFTKDEGLDFCNAYNEFEDVELLQAIEKVEKKLKEITPKAFNNLMTHVQLHYDMKKRNMRDGWRYYATAYLCELVREIILPLESLSTARACCRRDTIINEYLNSFSEEMVNEYFKSIVK